MTLILTRRHAIASAIGAPFLGLAAEAKAQTASSAQTPAALPAQASPAASSAAVDVAKGNWSHAAYEAAMRASGRPVTISQNEFNAIQSRRPAALKLIQSYLASHLGHADPAVMAAFAAVPREYYMYNYEAHDALAAETYEANPKPWAIGYGSALSDYLGQAYMTQVLQPKPGQTTLEIGTGSGYQSSVLSRIVDKAYSIEIIAPLGHAVHRIFPPIGYTNVFNRVGDGYYGWPEVEGGFDRIIVTCAAEYAPPELFKQLKPGGIMLIPIGQPFKRGQFLYVYTKDARGKIHSRRDVGVYFIPMTGAIMKKAAAQ
ncbi:protein-L-isoaspartate O-methyltransferase family protein [Acidisoma sp. C75]